MIYQSKNHKNEVYHHPSDLATIEMTPKSLQMVMVAPTKLIFGSKKMADLAVLVPNHWIR